MKTLKLPDWASIAEIAGTAAVVISLLFVASSLERNTNAVSGQSADEIYDAMRGIELAVLQDPELTSITVRGASNLDTLTELELERYKLYVVMFLDLWEQMTARESVGLLQPGTMAGWNDWFTLWTKKFLTPELWEELRWNYDDLTDYGFAEHIDATLSSQVGELSDS
jgi:hypothetical protein